MKTIMICGNLGANAIRRTASDGRELMTFSVAVSAGNENTLWFNCIGNLREKVLPYLVKGQSVAVVGDLSVSQFNGRIDLTVDIARLELVGRAPQSDENQQPAEPQSYENRQPTEPQSYENQQPAAPNPYSIPI